MERLIDAKALADHTGIPLQMIYRKTRRGEIPCYRSGRTIRYKRSEVEASMRGGGDVKKRGTRCRSSLADKFYQNTETDARGYRAEISAGAWHDDDA